MPNRSGEKLAELILGIATKLDRRAQSVAQLRRRVFEVVSEQPRNCSHVIFFQIVGNLCPHVPLIPLSRPMIDAPTPELYSGPSPGKPLGFHVAQPDWVMCGHNKLCARELPL